MYFRVVIETVKNYIPNSKEMTSEELKKQLEWTDNLKSLGVFPELSDFYWRSRKEGLLAVYEMSKRPKSYEEAKKQILEHMNGG